MKVALALVLTLACASATLAGNDPAQDYLSHFSPLDGDKAIHSSDTLLRLELDLDGDGQYEVLLSMARDQDGKRGNVWAIYPNTAAGYTRTGTLTFDPSSFYLGPIDDLGDYGLVTFRVTGDGEGMLSGYLFDGLSIRDVDIVSVTPDSPTVDSDTGQPRGQAVVDKYMSQTADVAATIVSTNAATLAKQFGLSVVGDQLATSLSSPATASTSSPASAGPDRPSSASSKEASRSIPWTLLAIILVLVVIAIGAVARKKRG